MRTIPWPKLNHGLSRARYFRGPISQSRETTAVVGLAYHIRADGAVEVTTVYRGTIGSGGDHRTKTDLQANGHREGHTTFVGPFDVIGDPRTSKGRTV